MIPDTLFGLVLFAAAVGPGYAFIRVREQHEPDHERSALLEAAELVVIGALVTTSVAMVLLIIANGLDLVDTSKLAGDPASYLLVHPLRGFGLLLLVFTLSPLTGWGLAQLIYANEAPSIKPGTVWAAVLGRDKASKIAYATIDLTDGRAVFGQVQSYSLDPEPETRELALAAPIMERVRQGNQLVWRAIPNDVLILAATDIRSLAIQYADRP